ncbi:MAG: winged helix-turn-helix transcriptional regulator [Deltaproteobacteria bacterium]|nr:winged helix-turn-helix transcriptional regulator [Deltaproteobacteria bacterium]
MAKRAEPPPRPTDIIFLAARLRDRAYEHITRELARMNLEGAPSHGAILVALLREQPLSLGELARIIDKRKSSTTELVEKLIRLGYVEKVASDEDQRVKLVRLTAKSQGMRRKFAELTNGLIERTFVGISPAEQRQAVALLARMVDNFEAPE